MAVKRNEFFGAGKFKTTLFFTAPNNQVLKKTLGFNIAGVARSSRSIVGVRTIENDLYLTNFTNFFLYKSKVTIIIIVETSNVLSLLIYLPVKKH